MDRTLLVEEIKELNRRYIHLCLRAAEESNAEASLLLNVDVSFIESVKSMTFDQIKSITSVEMALVQPVINSKVLTHALKIGESEGLLHYLSSARSVNIGSVNVTSREAVTRQQVLSK